MDSDDIGPNESLGDYLKRVDYKPASMEERIATLVKARIGYPYNADGNPSVTEQSKQAWETMGQTQIAQQYLPQSPSIYTALLGDIGGRGAKSLNPRERIWTILAGVWQTLRVSLVRFWN